MKEHIWKPRPYKSLEIVDSNDPENPKTKEVEKEPDFDGEILINLPSYPERLKYMKDAHIGKAGIDAVDRMIKMHELVTKHVKKVDLKKKNTTLIFSSMQDLEYDKEGSELLQHLGSDLLNGISLGKN